MSAEGENAVPRGTAGECLVHGGHGFPVREPPPPSRIAHTSYGPHAYTALNSRLKGAGFSASVEGPSTVRRETRTSWNEPENASSTPGVYGVG
ncbi:hypothetical protein [Streptomyces sp. NPDC049944]|uniref:hypothetical protein n=1 Tax=Streptomyces sp. NPDC049944 TaxID=3155657 RepID=UPI00344114F4